MIPSPFGPLPPGLPLMSEAEWWRAILWVNGLIAGALLVTVVVLVGVWSWAFSSAVIARARRKGAGA